MPPKKVVKSTKKKGEEWEGKNLSQRDQILLRPDTTIGNTCLKSREDFVMVCKKSSQNVQEKKETNLEEKIDDEDEEKEIKNKNITSTIDYKWMELEKKNEINDCVIEYKEIVGCDGIERIFIEPQSNII